MNSTFMEEAIRLAVRNVDEGQGGPFAAIVVKDGEIVATGTNSVTTTNDPTAHAEIVALRSACRILGTFQLDGCEIYTTCEPCPMCLGAIYWARPDAIYYCNTRQDAAAAGFDDEMIYRELATPVAERSIKMVQLFETAATAPFDAWRAAEGRVDY